MLGKAADLGGRWPRRADDRQGQWGGFPVTAWLSCLTGTPQSPFHLSVTIHCILHCINVETAVYETSVTLPLVSLSLCRPIVHEWVTCSSPTQKRCRFSNKLELAIDSCGSRARASRGAVSSATPCRAPASVSQFGTAAPSILRTLITPPLPLPVAGADCRNTR